MKNQANLLIDILLDPKARLDERDDAAMDLANYPEDKVVEALAKIARDPTEEDWLRDACGESIAEIWVSMGFFDANIYESLTDIAKEMISTIIKKQNPDLLKQGN